MSSRSLRLPLSFRLLAAALGAIVLPGAVLAQGDGPAPASSSATPVEPALNRLVGRRVANFRLDDAATGKPVALHGFRGKKAVVLVSMGVDCPVGNLYAPRLVELAREYEPKGVVFLGINSNAGETPEQVAAHAREHGLTFPVLRDVGNVIADNLMIDRTCEAILLDGMATLRYRGAIDDQYGYGIRRDTPEKTFLRDALEEVLTGGRVEVKGTKVVGCLVHRATPAEPKSRTAVQRVRPAPPAIVEALKPRDDAPRVGPVTFAGDVATIVQNRCQSCHREGEVGPFPLSGYDEVRKHAEMIREVVDNRRMPPWHADPRHGRFANDRSLSAAERATLIAWVDQGTPLGDPAKLPPAKTFPTGWTIGAPDLVFEIPEPQSIPAQGTVEYVHVRVPTKFKEDVWVQAAEARPGDRQVVHHIIVYVDDKSYLGRGRGFEGRVDAHLCGYAPGDMPSVYPPGSAKKIPAGSDLIFQLHYTPNGTMRTDRSKVGLILAREPVKHRAHTLGIAQPRFEIPPGADNHPVRSSFTFRHDAHLLSFMPHMHLRGKSFEYTVTFPDGRKDVLLSVPAYDFGWQSYYTLAEPLALPKGTRIDCLAHFDNSDKNLANPDSSKPVRWGEQTWEEMMIGYIDYIDDTPPDKPLAGTASGSTGATSGLSRVLRVLGRAASSRPDAPAAKAAEPPR